MTKVKFGRNIISVADVSDAAIRKDVTRKQHGMYSARSTFDTGNDAQDIGIKKKIDELFDDVFFLIIDDCSVKNSITPDT